MIDVEREYLENLVRDASKEDLEILCDMFPIEILQNTVTRKLAKLEKLKRDLRNLADQIGGK